MSSNPTLVPDEWDFYLSTVAGAPASILLNLWFGKRAPMADATTLYYCAIELLEPTQNGMGSRTDREALQAVEDSMGEWARAQGLYFVARVRSAGIWQLYYYGPPALEAGMKAQAESALGPGERKLTVGSEVDPDWSYFREFLWPDAERLQWIMDRKVVDALREEGDPLVESRRVDHWLYFPSGDDRDAFLTAAAEAGFGLEHAGDDGSGDRRFSAQIYRTESIQLEEIHDVVMALQELAAVHGGDYDGWETSVEKPPPN